MIVYTSTSPLNDVFKVDTLSEWCSTGVSHPSAISTSPEWIIEDSQNIFGYISENVPFLWLIMLGLFMYWSNFSIIVVCCVTKTWATLFAYLVMWVNEITAGLLQQLCPFMLLKGEEVCAPLASWGQASDKSQERFMPVAASQRSLLVIKWPLFFNMMSVLQ